MACSPVGLISSMDKALRPVIAKVMVPFPFKPEFFRFVSNRLGCWFYRGDHVHFHITMNFGQDRLRVVPHFSSGIVERAKRESGENHPTRESRFFSLGVILTCACISLALLSLRTNGGLLVVYGQDDFRATWLLVTEVVILLGASCYRNRVKRNMSVPTR